MLAAGLGRRLYGHDSDQSPKALLRFNEMTLLERHISILTSCGIEELIIVVGYKSHEIISEVNKVAPPSFTSFIFNERFKEGPKISLACADEVLRSGSDLLFILFIINSIMREALLTKVLEYKTLHITHSPLRQNLNTKH